MKRKRPKTKEPRKRRKGGSGNRKGAGFEREVCRALSLFVSKGKHEDLFWRSSMSGGRATMARRKGKAGAVRQSGDIVAVEKAGLPFLKQWYVECKFYKRVDLEGWLVKNTGKLKMWWARARKEARHYGKDPLLIIKQNGWPVLVVTRKNHVAHWAAPMLHIPERNADITVFDHIVGGVYAKA